MLSCIPLSYVLKKIRQYNEDRGHTDNSDQRSTAKEKSANKKPKDDGKDEAYGKGLRCSHFIKSGYESVLLEGDYFPPLTLKTISAVISCSFLLR